ncbi:MAG: hypothetical protein R3E96_13480 [Planctomycetota bacterium]
MPPPPPPYDSSQLAQWAKVDAAPLAKAIGVAAAGDFEQAVVMLAAAKEGASGELLERLTREQERAQTAVDYRLAWLKELQAGKKNLRIPVEDAMAAFKIDRIENGEVIFTKKRKSVDRIALKDLTPAILIENLGKAKDSIEPVILRLYLPALAGQEWSADGVEGLGATDAAELKQYAWMGKLGSAVADIEVLAAAGYPEDKAAKTELLQRMGRVNAVAKDVPVLNGIESDIKSYARDMADQVFAQASLNELVRGACTDLGEGRYKIVYEFDNPAELSDFGSVPDLFEFCMSNPDKAPAAETSGFLHNEGALAWAGRVGILHHVPFEKEMTIRYDWQASRIGDTFDLQGGNLLFGMAAEPKELNFLGQAFIHSVWCYAKGQLINNTNGLAPMYEKRTYKCQLSRDAAGNVVGVVDGKETGKATLEKVEYGPFFMSANLNIRGRLERLELEGKVDMDGLDYLRKVRAFEHLQGLGLDGSAPTRDEN